VWDLARRQHGLVTRAQLRALGYGAKAIEHRIAKGLACGPGALLSHRTAAALWGVLEAPRRAVVEVTVPGRTWRSQPGVRLHRRDLPGEHVTRRRGIPVTSPARTLLDIATRLSRTGLEEAVAAADRAGLLTTQRLASLLGDFRGLPGAAPLRAVVGERMDCPTDSILERRFLRLVKRSGLPLPQTQAHISGYRVDFYWPDLGLVVETDGLRYHRTPADQVRDRKRDQVLTAAGFTVLRFTYQQVTREVDDVAGAISAVFARLDNSA
jgi:very-short-patch-repair endonuclease